MNRPGFCKRDATNNLIEGQGSHPPALRSPSKKGVRTQPDSLRSLAMTMKGLLGIARNDNDIAAMTELRNHMAPILHN